MLIELRKRARNGAGVAWIGRRLPMFQHPDKFRCGIFRGHQSSFAKRAK
jgi:hypothetical protein